MISPTIARRMRALVVTPVYLSDSKDLEVLRRAFVRNWKVANERQARPLLGLGDLEVGLEELRE